MAKILARKVFWFLDNFKLIFKQHKTVVVQKLKYYQILLHLNVNKFAHMIALQICILTALQAILLFNNARYHHNKKKLGQSMKSDKTWNLG